MTDEQVILEMENIHILHLCYILMKAYEDSHSLVSLLWLNSVVTWHEFQCRVAGIAHNCTHSCRFHTHTKSTCTADLYKWCVHKTASQTARLSNSLLCQNAVMFGEYSGKHSGCVRNHVLSWVDTYFEQVIQNSLYIVWVCVV